MGLYGESRKSQEFEGVVSLPMDIPSLGVDIRRTNNKQAENELADAS
jgi:hypothetical protein